MKRILFAIVAFCLVFSFEAGASTDKAKKHYETAKALYVAGDVDGAIAELEKALEIDPNYEAAKKLYNRLGGGKKKAEPSSSVQVKQPQQAVDVLQIGSGLDRGKMKESLRTVVSNLIDQARADIFVLVSEVVKESFSETLKGESYLAMKNEMKMIVREIVKDIIEAEINEAFSSVREFSTNSYTNEFKLRQIESRIMRHNRSIGNPPNVQDVDKKREVDRQKAKELYTRAMELLDEEDYTGARRLLEDAAKLDPENREILRSLERLSGMMRR